MFSNVKRDFSSALENSSTKTVAASIHKKVRSTPSCASRRIPLCFETDELQTNDEIHTSIEISPVAKALMDTPQFQRLRHLKQLGTSSLVYMNANHTRFEHSIGVSHLAGRVMEAIQMKQPQLPCTSKDVLCLRLAGLLHDIGHGAFSHVYEVFVQETFPAYFRTLDRTVRERYNTAQTLNSGKKFSHEQVSLNMIDAALAHLGLEIDMDNLDQPLKEIGDEGGIDARTVRSFAGDLSEPESILTSRDFVFVKECIWGQPIPSIQKATGVQGFVGRPGWQKMYDIVANRHSGLDVDKLDYYARDGRRAAFGNGHVDEVMVREAVVAWGDCPLGNCQLCAKDRPFPGQHLMLCYKEKTTKALVNFFNERYKLHSTVYLHKTIRAVGHMICDIWCLADPYFCLSTAPYVRSRGNNDKPKSEYPSLSISQAMNNDQAFLRLRDSIIEEIANSSDEKLAPAAQLAGRFLTRDLYKRAGELSIDPQTKAHTDIWKMSKEEILQCLLEQGGRHGDENSQETIVLLQEDIIVDKFTMHHGKKSGNPMENIRVVSSHKWNMIRKQPQELPKADRVDMDNLKALSPMEQEQCVIRVYCRDPAKTDLLAHVFQAWLTDQTAACTTLSDDHDVALVSQSHVTPMHDNERERYSDGFEENVGLSQQSDACRNLEQDM